MCNVHSLTTLSRTDFWEQPGSFFSQYLPHPRWSRRFLSVFPFPCIFQPFLLPFLLPFLAHGSLSCGFFLLFPWPRFFLVRDVFSLLAVFPCTMRAAILIPPVYLNFRLLFWLAFFLLSPSTFHYVSPPLFLAVLIFSGSRYLCIVFAPVSLIAFLYDPSVLVHPYFRMIGRRPTSPPPSLLCRPRTFNTSLGYF